MIETYKIISGKYDSAITPTLGLLMSDTRKTRGNDFRLQKFRSKYDMRGIVCLIGLYLPIILMHFKMP